MPVLLVVITLAITVQFPVANASLAIFEPQRTSLSPDEFVNVDFFVISDLPKNERELRLESGKGISASLQISSASENGITGTLTIAVSREVSTGLHFVNFWIGNEQFVFPIDVVEKAQTDSTFQPNYLFLILALLSVAPILLVVKSRRSRSN